MNQTETPPLPPRALIALRSAIYWLLLFGSTILLTFPVILSSFISKSWCAYCVRSWVVLNMRALEFICKLDYHIEGEQNIPEHPCVIFSKHQSTWETLFIKLRFPEAIFVAKRELVLIPFFGWALASLNFILIDRRSGRKAIRQMVDQYIERKKEGYWLVIFPEGTRKAVGASPDYKIGGAIVAADTDSELLPVAVNAGEFWPRHSFLKWPGTITVSIGPAIAPAGKSAEQLRSEARNWIENKMVEITQTDRFPY